MKNEEEEFRRQIQKLEAAEAEREKNEAYLLQKGTMETATTHDSAGVDGVHITLKPDKTSDVLSQPKDQPKDVTDGKNHWFDKFFKAPNNGVISRHSSEDEEYRLSNRDAVPPGPTKFDEFIAPGPKFLTGAGTHTASGHDALSNAGGIRQRMPVAAVAARFDLGGRLHMDTGPMLPIVQPSQGRACSLVSWGTIVSQAGTGLGRVVAVV